MQQAIDYLGIDDVAGNKYFNISPNPTDGDIFINYSGSDKMQGRIEVSSLEGRVLYKTGFEFSNANNVTHIDLRSFAKGIYIINLRIAGMNMSEKVIIR
jgi:hypothetical protein